MKNKFSIFMLSLFVLIVGFAGGFAYNVFVYNAPKSDVYTSGELEIHFMELGNGFTGDSVYIKCGETDILVDGGSRTNSANTIENYVKDKMTDDLLDYTIITHADQDHIACFAGDGSNPSLFARFDVGTIIDFPLTNKKLLTDKGNDTTYGRYVKEREKEVEGGAKHFNALECYNNQKGASRSIELAGNTYLNILYNYFYENTSDDENNYSVCFQIEQGENRYLFTGDLEKEGEEYLVANNSLGKVVLFKAGHHGSPTSSNDCLLDVIKPEICVVCCCTGSAEYTDNIENMFPSQAFIDRISKHTDRVYATTVATIYQDGTLEDGSPNYKDLSFASLNGDIFILAKAGKVEVTCSNSDLLLKQTQWFASYRDMPDRWK